MTSAPAQSQIINLFQPDAGKTVTVPTRQHTLLLDIGFALDCNKIAREGQDLTFTFEDGGKILLQGYYDHVADKTLPIMILENGEILYGEDFLAVLADGEFLAAVAPGARADAVSGGYADAASNMAI